MDKLPFLVMLFYSIPESLLVCWLGLALINIRPDVKKLFLVAVTSAVLSLVIRELPVYYGVHTMIQMVTMVLVTCLILKVRVVYSLAAVLLGATALAFVEMVNIPLFCRFTGLELANILQEPLLRLTMGIPQLVVLMGVLFLVKKFDICIIKQGKSRNNDKDASSWKHQRTLLFHSLIIFIVLQIFLIAIMNFNFYLRETFSVLPPQAIMTAVTFLLILIVLVALKIFIKLIRLSEDLTQYQADMDNLKNVNELFASMRAQRHDFLNHVQALYGMLHINCFRDAQEYIGEVFKETVALNNVMVPGKPSLSALLHVKAGAAAARGIDFQVLQEGEVGDLPIPSPDLNRILGNLIDNAFDAVENLQPSRKKVKMVIKGDARRWLFEIQNPGQLDVLVKARLFEQGASTKKGAHMGMGLGIVRELTRKHGGEVIIDDSHGFICSQVNFPR